MSQKQPEALRLAACLENFRSFPDDIKAAAELRRLRATNTELLDELDAANTSRRAAQARVDELTEKMQALGRELHRHKQDAARYRLLRSAEGRGFPGIVVYEPDTGEMHVVTGVDADAAIDAAMEVSNG